MATIKVAVINTSKEIIDILQKLLQQQGFLTAKDYTYNFKDEENEFDTFIKSNRPQVILYDIAIPYEENYLLFKRLKSRESAEGIPFILTTTNKKALELLVGKTKSYEIIGKPYDLQQIVDAINKAYTDKQNKRAK